MKFPGRGQRDDPYESVSWGGEVKADTSRAGVVDDGNIGWPERIREAERQWPRARAQDFERTSKRIYVDRATGAEFKSVSGAPLLSIGTPANDGISCFFVDGGGRLVFLLPSTFPEARTVHHGSVVGREVPTHGGRGPRIY